MPQGGSRNCLRNPRAVWNASHRSLSLLSTHAQPRSSLSLSLSLVLAYVRTERPFPPPDCSHVALNLALSHTRARARARNRESAVLSHLVRQLISAIIAIVLDARCRLNLSELRLETRYSVLGARARTFCCPSLALGERRISIVDGINAPSQQPAPLTNEREREREK